MKKTNKNGGSWWNSETKKIIIVVTIIIVIVTAFAMYNRNYRSYITTAELQDSDLVFTVRGNEFHWELKNGDKVVTGECTVTLKTHGSDDPTEWEVVKYSSFCH